MIENHRSAILWSSFMANPEIAPALEAIGFVQDVVSTDDANKKYNWSVFPTISDDQFNVVIPNSESNISITLVDLMGREIPASISYYHDDALHYRIHHIQTKGLIWIVLKDSHEVIDAKHILIK